MLTLVELSEKEQELLAALEFEAGDEERLLSEEEQAELIDEYLKAQEGFHAKVDNYLSMISGLRFRSDFLKQEATRMTKAAKRDANLADKLQERLILCLQQRGQAKLITGTHKVSVVKNGGSQPIRIKSEWIEDAANAPERFQRRVIELDKKAIREAMKEGAEEAKGCEFLPYGFSIRIS